MIPWIQDFFALPSKRRYQSEVEVLKRESAGHAKDAQRYLEKARRLQAHVEELEHYQACFKQDFPLAYELAEQALKARTSIRARRISL